MYEILASTAGLAAIAGFATVLGAFANTKQVQQTVARVSAKTKLPKAVTLFVFIAEFAEIGKTVQHISVMSVLVSAMLFTIVMAAKSGDGELES